MAACDENIFVLSVAAIPAVMLKTRTRLPSAKLKLAFTVKSCVLFMMPACPLEVPLWAVSASIAIALLCVVFQSSAKGTACSL